MKIKICAILFVLCLSGCTMQTQGHSEWELYLGVRAKQVDDGPNPASIGIESKNLDKIVDSLTDGEISEAE